MKKFLSLLLIAVMLLSTFAFTSCDLFGSDTATSSTTASQEQEQPKDVRTTVTEEEWESMKDITNFSLRMQQNDLAAIYEYSDTAVYIDYVGTKMIVDFNKKLILGESSIGWLAMDRTDDELKNYQGKLGDLGMFSIPEFEKVSYDEESKAYKLVEEYYVSEFRFENGILSYAKNDASNSNSEAYVEVTNVGKTVARQYSSYIHVGDGKVEPNAANANVRTTVTDAEWNAAIALNNFTISMNSLSSSVTTMTYKQTENAREEKYNYMGQNDSNIDVIIDGLYYTLIEKDGKIYARKTTQTTGDNIFSGMFGDASEMTEFTYDEEGRYYYWNGEETGFYLYFANGVMTQIVVTNKFDSGTMEIICPIYDIGTTTIDIPEYEIEPEELEFELNDEGTGYIVDGIGTFRDSELVIPETYKGLPVVAIDSGAFWGSQLTSVVIPNTVTRIGSLAFYDCANLVSVVIPSSVTEIGYQAFYRCINIIVYCEVSDHGENWDMEWHCTGYDNETNESTWATIVWNYVSK